MIDLAGDRAAMFADTMGFAVSATWLAGGDPPGIAVRLLRSQPDEITEFGAARLKQASIMIKVRVAEIATPAKDDRFVIDGETYIVQSAPIRDVEALTWTINLRPA